MLIPIIALFTLAIVGYFLWPYNIAASEGIKSEKSPSIAVLPFRDMSPEQDQEYFSDGISEEILNNLSHFGNLKVAGRTSSFSFKNKEATIAEIGDALNVSHILEGSVRKHDDQIRISAQLINVSDGFQLWSDQFDMRYADIFAIQDSVAEQIGLVLLKQLAPEEVAGIKESRPKNSEAYDLYLKAQYISRRAYNTYRKEDYDLVEDLLLKSISIDSTYALSHTALADLYDFGLSFHSKESEEYRNYYKKCLEHIEIASRLDPDLAQVNLVKGWLMSRSMTAETMDSTFSLFKKAYELSPNSIDGYFGLAVFYRDLGLLEDAQKFYEYGIEIDPLYFRFHYDVGKIYRRLGKFEQARTSYLSALDIIPNTPQALLALGDVNIWLRNNEAALENYNQGIKIWEENPPLEINPRYQEMVKYLNGELGPSYIDSSFIYAYLEEDTSTYHNLLENGLLSWNYDDSDRPLKSAFCDLKYRYPWTQNLFERKGLNDRIRIEESKYREFQSRYPRAEELIGIN